MKKEKINKIRGSWYTVNIKAYENHDATDLSPDIRERINTEVMNLMPLTCPLTSICDVILSFLTEKRDSFNPCDSCSK